MQLMMSIAKKRYDNIVRKLKGTGQLWEDPDFPVDKAIGNVENLPKYEWKRPKVGLSESTTLHLKNTC